MAQVVVPLNWDNNHHCNLSVIQYHQIVLYILDVYVCILRSQYHAPVIVLERDRKS